MKKMAACILALCMLGGAACRGEEGPAVYRVRDAAGHTLYLFGTAHMGRTAFSFGASLEEAWRASQALAVEADVTALLTDAALSAEYNAAVRYDPGDDITRHLSPETYALGLAALNQPENALKRLRPMAWLSLAEQAAFLRLGYSGEYGADQALLLRAKAENRPVEELEGFREQIRMIREAPDAACDALLRDMLCDPAAWDQMCVRQLEAWARGDEAVFARLMEQDRQRVTDENRAALQSYYTMIYDQRNARFTRQAEAYLASGKTVLMAVGAAHAMGPGGVAERLHEMGCHVEIMNGSVAADAAPAD